MGEMASAMMIGGEAAASGAGMMGAGAEGIGAAGTAGAALGGANTALGGASGAAGGLLQGIPVLSEGGDGLMAMANLSGEAAAPAANAVNPFFSAINTGIDKVADNVIQPVAGMMKSGVNAVGDAATAAGNWIGGNETLQQIGETAKHFDDRILGGVGQDVVGEAKDVLSRAWKDMPNVVARNADGSIDTGKTIGNVIYKGGKSALLGAMNRGNQPALTLDTSAPRTNAKREEAEDSEEELRLLREKMR